MERWEKIERWCLVTVGVAIFVVVVRFIAFGAGHPMVLLLIPIGFWTFWQAFYEDELESENPPSRTERVLATTWLWMRRVLLWAIGLPLTLYSAVGVFGAPDLGLIAGPLGGLFLGLVSLWVGTFGGGRYTNMTDDFSIHKLRKKRYKW